MIRIRLAADDLARTRIAPSTLPLHEVFLSLAAARSASDPELSRWRVELRQRMPKRAWPLFELGSATGFPDFLAPVTADGTLDAALAAVLATPAQRMAEQVPEGRWRRLLAAGDDTARRVLGGALREYHDSCVAAELAARDSLVRLDVAARTRALATGGVEALFASLYPLLRWESPVLTVQNSADLDLCPGGLGITLVPSVFASRMWVGTDPSAVYIAYPVRRAPSDPVRRPLPAGDPLIALLGRSRAAVLRAAVGGANTTDLARRAGISAPSASQHATVLRDAGLLDTTRHGKAAHHTLTALARALLTADDLVTRELSPAS